VTTCTLQLGVSSPAAKKARVEAPTEADTAGAPKVCFQQEWTVIIVTRKSVLACHLMACTKCGVVLCMFVTGCY
jgi:hypothetical protein